MLWFILAQLDQPMPQGTAMLNALATVATSVGLSSALILFFVWQAWNREQRLITRIETLEDFARTTLISLTKETTVALMKDAEATSACTEAIRSNTTVIASTVQTTRDVKDLLVEHHRLAQSISERIAADEKG